MADRATVARRTRTTVSRSPVQAPPPEIHPKRSQRVTRSQSRDISDSDVERKSVHERRTRKTEGTSADRPAVGSKQRKGKTIRNDGPPSLQGKLVQKASKMSASILRNWAFLIITMTGVVLLIKLLTALRLKLFRKSTRTPQSVTQSCLRKVLMEYSKHIPALAPIEDAAINHRNLPEERRLSRELQPGYRSLFGGYQVQGRKT